MAFLTLRDREEIGELFHELDGNVRLIHFTDREPPTGQPGNGAGLKNDTCRDTRSLLEEVASLSKKVELEIHDFATERVLAAQYGISRIPAFVMLSDGIRGNVRYFGLPSGYEFSVLIGGLVAASKRQTDLRRGTKESLKEIHSGIHIQVFVTPTCSYCAPMAKMAHQMAMESPCVSADVVEISEFEDLATKYVIQGVPKIVINDRIEIIGAVSEEQFMEHVQRAL